MLKPLPYRDGDRFVAIFSAAINDPEHYASLSSRDAQTYQERTRVFDAFGWFRDAGKNLTFAGEPHHVQGVAVTPPLAHQLGVDPILGQWFQDETRRRDFERRSGGGWEPIPASSARPLTLDGRSYTVTGVMPEPFQLPVAGIISAGLRTDVWIPLDPQDERAGARLRRVRAAQARRHVCRRRGRRQTRGCRNRRGRSRQSSRLYRARLRSSGDRHQGHPADAAAAVGSGSDSCF